MAKKTEKPDIDPSAPYDVELTASITVGRLRVHPGPRVHLRGDVLIATLQTNPSAVKGFKPAA